LKVAALPTPFALPLAVPPAPPPPASVVTAAVARSMARMRLDAVSATRRVRALLSTASPRGFEKVAAVPAASFLP